MALTLRDLQQKLKLIDEISLMEVLEITSEDLVLKFVERIEEKFEELETEFDDGEDKDFYIPWSDEDGDIEEELEEDEDYDE